MEKNQKTGKQALLKKAGLKNTLPRKLILETLESNPQRHFSAEELYQVLMENGENVGIATVYRVLAQFESAGLVLRHHFESSTSVFELGGRKHHDHLICTDCGAIIEFLNEDIEKLQRQVAKQQGFRLHDHALCIYASCENADDCPRRMDRNNH